jgi:hypothetical protein
MEAECAQVAEGKGILILSWYYHRTREESIIECPSDVVYSIITKSLLVGSHSQGRQGAPLIPTLHFILMQMQ